MSKLIWPDRMSSSDNCPWVGPKPYPEGHPFYEGRDFQLRKVLDKIGVNPLQLLTGFSGSGKTSFLNAALIPIIRRNRSNAIKIDKENTHAWPFVLVVRDWNAISQEFDPNKILLDAIFKSISNSAERIQGSGQDHRNADKLFVKEIKALSDFVKEWKKKKKTENNSVHQFLCELVEKTNLGNILICFDQFEEILQGSENQRDAILNVVAQMAKRNPYYQIIISFRQEWKGLFEHLDIRIGNLALITVYITQMTLGDISSMVKKTAKKAHVTIEGEAIKGLLDWMDPKDSESTDLENSDSTGSHWSFDLLKLQALLVELYQISGGRKITSDTLKTLLESTRNIAGQDNLKGSELFQSALNIYLEKHAFPLPYLDGRTITSVDGLPQDIDEKEDDRLMKTLIKRRIAARFAPFLSSGNLKTQQYASRLIGESQQQVWKALNIYSSDVIKYLTGKLKVNKLLRDADISPMDPMLSGKSKNKNYTKHGFLKEYIDLCNDVLISLKDEVQIIRSKSTQWGELWELVHDGFGPAFCDWGDRERSDPLDSLVSPVALFGESFRWKKVSGNIDNVCWRGCTIEPDFKRAIGESSSRVKFQIFNKVSWKLCDLRGTIFKDCQFNEGSFDNCDLHGVVFFDCFFKKVTFKNIRATGLSFLGGSLRSVTFEEDLSSKEPLSKLTSNQEIVYLNKMLWGNTGNSEIQVSDIIFKNCNNIYQWSVESPIEIGGVLKLQNSNLELCDLRNIGLNNPNENLKINSSSFEFCRLPDWLEKLVNNLKTQQNRSQE